MRVEDKEGGDKVEAWMLWEERMCEAIVKYVRDEEDGGSLALLRREDYVMSGVKLYAC